MTESMAFVKVHRLLANLPDGKPGLMIARNCTNLIKQIQNLVSDPRNPEDVDTKAEDHALILSGTY